MIWNQPDAAAYSSRDRIAKQLEIEAIAKFVTDGMTVLDVGCGDGETALELVRRFDIQLDGLDFSTQMLVDSIARGFEPVRLFDKTPWITPIVKGRATLWHGDVTKFDFDNKTAFRDKVYDLIYTERCLINLPDWETQRKAISNIAQALKPGGLYVMLENSWEGVQAINDLREKVGLYRIEPPGHNRYLRDAEIAAYAIEKSEMALLGVAGISYGPNIDGLILVAEDDYSGPYYFLSRVVNAALAAQEGKEPDYDSPINKVALSLPPIAGLRGQGRIWLWRKV